MNKARRWIRFAIMLAMIALTACGAGAQPASEEAARPEAPASPQAAGAAQAVPAGPPAAAAPAAAPLAAPSALAAAAGEEPDRAAIASRYRASVPARWGEHVPGVMTRLRTQDKVIALTFDACGGKEGSGFDKKLIDYLDQEQIPATLFINARWIDANPDAFAKLAANPLFEIENHGSEHRPLSVTGRAAYGISGTKSAAEAFDEVQRNEDKIEKLTGRRPLFFRSGTAYYDDVAVQIVQDLGLRAVNYNVLGDAGATYNTEQVYKALMKSQNGSIALMHMNHPEKDTAKGVMKAVPKLKEQGFTFVRLADYPLE